MDILNAFKFNNEWFPMLKEAGDKVGWVHAAASEKTGIPQGVPVFAAGHDTQFAIYGSGAGTNEPVLSSGTWEILMARTTEVITGEDTLEEGITTELDVVKGVFNPGIQWLGSKHIEDLKRDYFNDVKEQDNVFTDFWYSCSNMKVRWCIDSRDIRFISKFNIKRFINCKHNRQCPAV